MFPSLYKQMRGKSFYLSLFEIPNYFCLLTTSIGIEPMYPHACLSEPVNSSLDANNSANDEPVVQTSTTAEVSSFISPTDLANQLISLPCSLTMQRQNSIIFYQLIMTARDYMLRMRNIFQFYLSACLSLSLAQMITSLLFLPPLLSPGIVIWLSLIVMPVLSISLMGNETDPNVMNIATGRKLHFNKEVCLDFNCHLINFCYFIIRKDDIILLHWLLDQVYSFDGD